MKKNCGEFEDLNETFNSAIFSTFKSQKKFQESFFLGEIEQGHV